MQILPPPILMACVFLLLYLANSGRSAETIPMAGEWRLGLDRRDVGVKEAWFNHKLANRITLPGVLQAQGYGAEISTNTPWVLSLYDQNWFLREDYKDYTQPGHVKVPFLCQPPRHYLGAAWYQRDIEIPTDWVGRRMELFLERTRWETRAWLDDRPLGTNNSLCTPHEFEVGIVGNGPGQVKPGRHRVTVRVDNRMLMDYRPDAHAVSDSLGSTWNGIVGKIEMRSTPLVWIEDVQVFPDFKTRSVTVKIHIGNQQPVDSYPSIDAAVLPQPRSAIAGSRGKEQQVRVPVGGCVIEWTEPLPQNFKPWDEFEREIQTLRVSVSDDKYSDRRFVEFGVRDFTTVGQDFYINGRPTHLRGTHHGGDFPLTGYPPCDEEYWVNLWFTCKAWGLNHVRFHSFCPPEAAFAAADFVGIYLQVEPGMWNAIDPGSEMEQMLYAETERMLKAYGNHPSFVLLSASNEAKGRWKESLPRWVKHFGKMDPRHLYTPDTGWSLIDKPGPVDGANYLAVHRIGQNMMRGNRGWFGRDYSRSTRGVNVPIVTHEVGQWCAYPDYSVIDEFKGYLQPGNYEIFRASMKAHGLLDRNKDFAWASGRFQLACYKEEIEANLRTPGLGGFQLLDLHDYVGQGTALVGVLDPFWKSKGYVELSEWRQFCSPVVPLARLTQRVSTTPDRFEVPVAVANYSASALANARVSWAIVDAKGRTVVKGEFPKQTIALGRTPNVGTVRVDLAKPPAPAQYKLAVRVGQYGQNQWDFWVYPSLIDSSVPKDVLLTSSWTEAEARLALGGRVVFQPPQANLDWSSPPLDRQPIFWNRLMGPGWSRMLGIWCDTSHPALAKFPTEANCDWQWTEIIKTRAMNLDDLPAELSPIVSAIDDWNRNWKLGLVWEAQVGGGRLLVSTFDLDSDKLVAKQLRRSLLDYAASEKFQPSCRLQAEQIRAQWFDTLVMRKLGAKASSDSGDASAAIDGDPNSAWLTGSRAGIAGSARHPHQLTITFPQRIPVRGVVLMNRQNDRNHEGDIRQYGLSISEDGENWRVLREGELASTWSPQRIEFGKTVAAKALKLVAKSGFGNDPRAALAELAVIYAGTDLSDEPGGNIEYQRARSTSTDIDEGDPGP